MTPLGKPLVFYLKYMAEMNHLYYPEEHGGEPDLTGVDDPEQIREMARTVGAAASEQVADFLELCGREIAGHFTDLGIATLAGKTRRPTVVRDWSWSARIDRSSAPDGPFWCGMYVSAPPEIRISMEKDACGIVVPWLWCEGGRKGEEALWQILGGWPYSRSGELVDIGNVALACIPIKPQPPESFDVDRDPLIAEVMKIFARIGAEEIKAIASFVAGLKESKKAEFGSEIEKEEP